MTALAKSKIGARSQERIAIQGRLSAAGIGETVTWDELEALTSVPRSRVYSMVRDAARHLENERMMHFITRPGIGVERVDNATVARETLPKKRQRIVAAAKSTARTARKLDLATLSPDERYRAIITGSLAETIAEAASSKGVKRLESESERGKVLSPLSPREILSRLLSG